MSKATLMLMGIALVGIGAGWWIHPGAGLLAVGVLVVLDVLLTALDRSPG